MAVGGDPREELEQQRRFADPRFAREQRDRPGDEPSAQDPIEIAQSRGDPGVDGHPGFTTERYLGPAAPVP